MPTVLSHPVAPLALAPWFGPRLSPGVVALGALCSVLPDADVVGFKLGVAYGDLLGHRGLSHSFVFAAAVAGAFTALVAARRRAAGAPSHALAVGLFLFLSTASHGLLDTLTDGGLGVALLSPLSEQRLFAPLRPIVVSPISVQRFLSGAAWPVLTSELRWIWIPGLALAAVGRAVGSLRGLLRARAA
jgi:inner membrane protein